MTARVASTTIEVEIFGSTYKVRGDNDPEQLQGLADVVDGKMREIATQTATVDTAKIAILAALNIAEELRSCRAGMDGERRQVTQRVAGLLGQLESALEG